MARAYPVRLAAIGYAGVMGVSGEETGGEWRQGALERVLSWTVVFGGLLGAISVVSIGLSTPQRLFMPSFALMFGSFGAVVVLRYLPNLSYRTRAFGFCASTFVMGASALINVGARPGPLFVSAFVVIATRLFMGRTAMILALIATTLAVLFAAMAHGIPDLAPGAPIGALEAVRLAASFAMPTLCIVLFVSHVVGKLEYSLHETSDALERVRVTDEERLQAVTALAQTEAALARAQKLEAVGRLAAGVGHDFNNTLQVVLSWTSLLREETDPNVVREGLDTLEQAALAGSELTRRLLAFGRRDVHAPVACSPLELIQDSAKSLRRLLPEDIAIELDLDASAPNALLDPAQISHVLLNLGVNARDAMPSGGVLSLAVATALAAELPEELPRPIQSGRFLHIRVSDTGTGMSPETRAHVFEPFFTTKGDRGTGLGLATAYAVVRQNRGIIYIESEEGKGTQVHIYFPEHLAAQSEVAPSPARERRATGELVMIAEDDPDVRGAMVRVLGAAGYRVLASADAASAMEQLERVGADVDVLCTDGIMPGGGTRQLIDHYRSKRPLGQVIVCSGYVQEELLRRDIDAGDLEYLPKPFPPSELVRRIDAMLTASAPAQKQRA